jgi:3-oxoacyl-[acyl-carrier-protein] synthase-3
LGIDEDWIVARTGVRSRRVAGEGETTTALAAEAGAAALARAELEAGALDLVIVATCTPDHGIPATAPMVAARLGASCAAFDLNAGCAGFLYALAQAHACIASGAAGNVLVCGADVLSRVTDYSDPKSCVLFGDGAGAIVLARCEDDHLGPFLLASDGSRPELLWIPPGRAVLAMEGREVYRRAVEQMTASALEVLAQARLSADDVDLLVAHQANARIVKAVAERAGVPPERVPINIERFGNTSAASIPLVLAEAADSGELDDGDVVLLAAFGAGFTWGAGLMRWGAPAPKRAPALLAGRAGA